MALRKCSGAKLLVFVLFLFALAGCTQKQISAGSQSTESFDNLNMNDYNITNVTKIDAVSFFYSNGTELVNGGSGSSDGNNYSTGVSVTGASTKTIQISRSGFSNISASFTDIDTDTQLSGSDIVSKVGNATAVNTSANIQSLGFVTGSHTTDTNETTRMDEIYSYDLANRSKWDSAYSWGNHALVGYLTSYTNTYYNVSVLQSYRTNQSGVVCQTDYYAYGYYSNGTPKCRADSGAGAADLNNYSTAVSFAGTTTKTIQISRSGFTNISASFTDIDTTCNGASCSISNTGTLDGYEGAALLDNTDSQTLSYATATDVISISGGNSIDITEVDTNTQLSGSEVIAFVGNATAVNTTANIQSLGFVTGSHTVDTDTTYSAGSGISLAATTFSVAGNTCLTQDAGGLSVTANCVGDTQLAFDTGQALTTTSSPTFLTVNTGQGANELYAMDQNVQTTSNVEFRNITTQNISIGGVVMYYNGSHLVWD